MNRSSRKRLMAWAGAALLGVLGTVADPEPSMAQPVVEAARAALPETVRSAGVIRAATSYQWPPFGFETDGSTPDGIDVRLVRLLAAKLGLKADFEDIKFPSIVPGVLNGRYDVGVNGMVMTAERQKTVDFVPYFNISYGLLVRRGTAGLQINHLCGRTLALTQGSAQIAVAERLSARCKAAGEPEVASLFFPNSADTYLAVANGRGDGFISGTAIGIYIASKNNKLEMAPGSLDGATELAGIVVAKGNKGLQQALNLAMESALADGSYTKILSDFGVQGEGVTAEQLRLAKAAN